MNRFKKCVFSFILFLCCSVTSAEPIAKEHIPPVLQDWQAWVLYEHPEHVCPFLYSKQDNRYCAWPTQLTLDVSENKIYFNQTWQVFAPSTLALPGDANLWPQQVNVNGRPHPIIEKDQTPVMELNPGVYQVQGYLAYTGQIPESIKIPEHTGLVQLIQKNKKINHPQLNEGRLWLLQEQQSNPTAALALRVFRKVTQAVPMTVQTVIELDASGPAREVQLGPVLLSDSVATRVDSALPAQLDEKGLLHVQLRPGKWQIEITERFLKPINTLKRAEVGPPWPSEEIWSFALSPELGAMNVSGVANIDPTQTLMPAEWRNLPAYRVRLADSVLLTTNAVLMLPENQLSLNRHMWLDFSGDFWTVEDALNGQMLKTWRLSLHAPFTLGRFTINNQDQLITILENAQGQQSNGVEIRQGHLSANAMSLIEKTWRMPINGWNEKLNAVSTTLSLPPGWQLFTAMGVDQVTGSLLSQWTLFDLFIVLLMACALATILGKKWGLIAFVMLLCIYHQSVALVLIWLNLALILWLVQWFKQSRAEFLLKLYRDLSFAVLAVMIIGFSSVQIISNLYPQIKMPTTVKPVVEETALLDTRPMSKMAMMESSPATPVDAKTQTGPAKPKWEWMQIQLNWQTSVADNQHVYLLLVSPFMQKLFTLLQIFLLLAVGLHFWYKRNQKLEFKMPRSATLGLPLAALLFSSMSMPTQAQEIPSAELLNTLKERLLVNSECLPNCASIGEVVLSTHHDELLLQMQISAAERVAAPIPGRSAYWQAEQVLVDGVPAKGLFWQDNTLMVQLESGQHTVTVKGKTSDRDKISLEFGLHPHWVEVNAPSWFVEGLNENKLTGSTLHLLRREHGAQNEHLSMIQPFVRVIRHLSLGLTGEVTTTIQRIAPVTGAIQLSIPLLPHESVTTSGIAVQDNQAQIYLAPNQREISWQSTLSNYNDLTLFAPQTQSWVEDWIVEISSQWHPTITGIPALYQSSYNTWQAHWQPWPLQSVHIQLMRPQALVAPTVTIDQVNIFTHAFERDTEFMMQALLRSTIAGQQKIILPEGASVERIRINGIDQPTTSSNEILLPYGPGNNWVDLTWRSTQSIGFFTRTPQLDWGMPAYNINSGLNIPHDRWIIALGGKGFGPAQLDWLWIVGAIILAVILGNWSISPLKTSQWLLLTVGLSIVSPLLGLWVVVALVLVGLYGKLNARLSVNIKRIAQFGVYGFLVIAALVLCNALFQALSGMPHSHIIPSALTANISADFVWLQDFAAKSWPRAWIISLPIWVYRVLMLLWSLGIILLVLRLLPKVTALIRKPAV